MVGFFLNNFMYVGILFVLDLFIVSYYGYCIYILI